MHNVLYNSDIVLIIKKLVSIVDKIGIFQLYPDEIHVAESTDIILYIRYRVNIIIDRRINM